LRKIKEEIVSFISLVLKFDSRLKGPEKFKPVYTLTPSRSRWFQCRSRRRAELFPCQVRQSHRQLRTPDHRKI